MKKTLVIAICCVLLLLALGALTWLGSRGFGQISSPTASAPTTTASPSPIVGIRKGNIAPDFTFTTIDGKTATLSSLRGQPVIFAFVLTVGCAPCAIEAATVREAQQQVPFRVIQLAINLKETVDDLRLFRDTLGTSEWFIGYDTDNAIAQQYGVRAIDTTIMVDANGAIIYRDDGYPIEEPETIVNLLKTSAL